MQRRSRAHREILRGLRRETRLGKFPRHNSYYVGVRKPFAALGLYALLTLCGAAPRAEETPTYIDAQEADIDTKLLGKLKVAEESYEKGISHFRTGNARKARTALKKAFAILTDSLEEDRLSAALQSDFLSMLEKVRTWETGDTRTEYPSELEASEEELKTVHPISIPAASKKHDLKIDPDNEITQKYLHIYTKKRPESVEQALARSGRYKNFIAGELAKAGLPHELFYLVMTESEYKLNAVSRSGAAGLWQFMPGTARHYGMEVSYWIDERFHPEKATKAAIRHLKDLHDWFGDWHLALAAYNRGLNGIGRDLQFSRAADFGGLANRKAIPQETHNYVPKFMACVLLGEDPKNYGLNPKYEDPDEFDTVKLDKDLDLEIAAKAAGTDKETIRRLNPHIRAWCTPKNRPGFGFRIPKGTTQVFWKELKKIKNWNPGPQIVKYKIRSGDYLGKIARSHRTTVKSIAALNNIKDPRLIRPGVVLKIRPGKGFYQSGK
jgi:LysM repeat protein